MKPLVSVIIPIYNHAHTIERSLNSIFKQTYRPIEIIMVDDGSTDNFKQKEKRLLEDAKKNNVNLKILYQENSGAPCARNFGFRESQGEMVIFWDADTIGKKKMIETMYNFLTSHPEASYAYSQFRFGWKKMKSRDFSDELLKKNNFIDTTSLMRRAVFTSFDEKLKRFQDWDLWLGLLEQGKRGVFIKQVLYKKLVGFREGISKWLPSFTYRYFTQNTSVKKYAEAKAIILKKHHLLNEVDFAFRGKKS